MSNLRNDATGKVRPALHGECVLKPVSEIPKAEKTEKLKTYTVAHSETGHNHVLESVDVEFEKIMTEEGMFLKLEKEATLLHQKNHDIHENTTIAPGLYKINDKTEYDPFNDVERPVFD